MKKGSNKEKKEKIIKEEKKINIENVDKNKEYSKEDNLKKKNDTVKKKKKRSNNRGRKKLLIIVRKLLVKRIIKRKLEELSY